MIDIVIVNWNAGKLLQDCVESILSANNDSLVSKVIVIDNNSKDNSLFLLPYNPKIKLIHNKRNEGFAKACNQGFKIATAKYVLLLNPDTRLFTNTLHDCVKYMEGHPETDILGCQLLNEENSVLPSCSRFPRPYRFLTDALGLFKIFPKIFKPSLVMEDWDHKSSRYVDQVMGAFMFMRNDIFERVGYFDERFFVYMEEVDFSKRLAEMGGKTWFDADIQAFHMGKGTTASVTAFRLFLSLRSQLLYARKHFSLPGQAIMFLASFIIQPFSRTFFHFLKGDFREIGNTWKGYYYFLRNPIKKM